MDIRLRWCLIGVMFVAWVNLLWVMPAAAEICRVYGSQTICLVSVKRSAKYYWEYRAVLRIDGKKFPIKTFDCRHDLDLANNQRKFVCSLMPKRL